VSKKDRNIGEQTDRELARQNDRGTEREKACVCVCVCVQLLAVCNGLLCDMTGAAPALLGSPCTPHITALRWWMSEVARQSPRVWQ
jgi:hypothetical protein